MDGFELVLSLFSDLGETLIEPSAFGVGLGLLAAVFVVSGVAKVRRPVLAAGALVDFGVVRRLRISLGYSAGVLELTLACLLVLSLAWSDVTWVALVLVAGLLWILAALVARALAAGHMFVCACFGDPDAVTSRWTLARAVLLAAAATGLAVAADRWTGSPSVETGLLQLITGTAIVGIVAIALTIPRLLRWNRDPFRMAESNWVRRAA